MRKVFDYAYVSRALALILIGAGLLKAMDLGAPLWSNGANWFDILHPIGEVLFGLWLLIGLYSRTSWFLSGALFVTFLAISLNKALSGNPSCDCLGAIQVSPWYSVAFNIVALSLLILAHPAAKTQSALVRPRLVGFALIAVPLAAAIPVGSRFFHNGTDAAQLHALAVSPQPEQWVGQQLPLMPVINIRDQLQRGEWLVMFYHGNCQPCREAIPQFLALAHEYSSRSTPIRLALIEVPPLDKNDAGSRSESFVRGQLSGMNRSPIRTPLFVHLRESVVSKVSDVPDRGLADESNAPNSQSGYLFPDYMKARRELFLKEIACGPLALIAVLNHLEVKLTPQENEELLAVAGSRGTDMLQLKQLAEARGLRTLGVAISTSGLRRLGLPAIVHLNDVGFAAITGYSKEGLRVVFPLAAPGILPDDVFEMAFGKTGNALLLSRSEIPARRLRLTPSDPGPPASGPHLRLSRSMLTAGRTHSRAWEAETTVHNDGMVDLEIIELTPLCQTFTATVERKRIPPGESTVLRARGRHSGIGDFNCAISVLTNQNDAVPLRIPIRGYVETPVCFEQPGITLRGVRPNEKRSLQVPFIWSPDIQLAKLMVKAPRGAPIEARIQRNDQGNAVLTVNWLETAETGMKNYQIDVGKFETKDSVSTPLLVAVDVVPSLRVEPESLSIRATDLTKGRWSRRVVVQADTAFDGAPSVTWSDTRLTRAIKLKHTQINALTSALEFELNESVEAAVLKDSAAVKLSFPGKGEFEVRLVLLQ